MGRRVCESQPCGGGGGGGGGNFIAVMNRAEPPSRLQPNGVKTSPGNSAKSLILAQHTAGFRKLISVANLSFSQAAFSFSLELI